MKSGRAWLPGVLAFVLLAACFAPPFSAYRAWLRVPEVFGNLIEVRRGVNVSLQIANPMTEIADPIHKIVRWRLLFPVLGYVFSLPPMVLLGLAHVGCLLATLYVAAIYRRWCDRASFGGSLAVAVILGSGSWFFTSMTWLGYFDSWLTIGFLAAAFSPHAWVVVLASALTPWVDERFVLGYPLAMFIRWLLLRPKSGSLRSFLLGQALFPSLVLAGYVVVRFRLQALTGGADSMQTHFSNVMLLRLPFRRIAFGIWDGLRIGWLPVAALLVGLFRAPSRPAGAVLLLGVAATAAGGLATANDLSRSMVLLVPAVLFGLIEWGEAPSPRWRRAVLPPLAALALVLPAHHVVSDFVMPVRSLRQEWRQLERPAPALDWRSYLAEGGRRAQAGELGPAAGMIEVAVRLSGYSVETVLTKALFLARVEHARGRLPLAADAYAPQALRPEILLGRAQMRLAAGDPAGAHLDLQAVVSFTPPSSPIRAAAEALMRSMPATPGPSGRTP